ncbi:FeoA family protein [Neisseria montereyensis]|uniref:Ferrous iron transport protein A n=1 Tax=Neisseria montereyensis TaxID=2973938 RepID=A0ABT2FC66_9NEIS|nr:FeoA family protein [Neisseria montereyensis]MCS4533747.1 ferrous iron transport protein A [Neisseria montereyensis]
MSAIPLSNLHKGASAYIESIQENPEFGELDFLVTRRLSDLGFSNGMSLKVMAVGGLGKGPFAVRLGNQSQFALREPEASKIMCRLTQETQQQ